MGYHSRGNRTTGTGPAAVEHYRNAAPPGAQLSSPHQQAILSDLLQHALGDTTVDVALDLGCGQGSNLRQLAFRAERVVAADVSASALDDARSAHGELDGRIETVLLTGGPLPFDDGVFPLALCTEVLEHVDDLEATAAELERVTKPGGYIVVSTPNYRNVMGLVKRYKDWRSGRSDFDPWEAHAGGFERLVTAPQILGVFRQCELLEERGADYAFALGIMWSPLRWRLSRYLLLGPGRHRLLARFGMQYSMLLRRK